MFGIGHGLAFVAEYVRDFRVAETGRLFGVHLKSGEISVAPTPEVCEQLCPAVEEALRRLPNGLPALEVGKPFFGRLDHPGFDAVLELQSDDGAARVLGERARRYVENPRPDDGSGVCVQTRK